MHRQSSTRAGILAIAFLAAFFSIHGEALASEGCTKVNAGALNIAPGGSGPRVATVGGFAIGDTITFDVVIGASTGESMWYLDSVRAAPTDRSPRLITARASGIQSHKITGDNGDTTLLEVALNNVGVTATCKP
jgi:hypothetical protein